MKTFNAKDFSLQNLIQARVQKESDIKWGQSEVEINIPKYQKVEVKRNSAWWWNFFRTQIYQLKP